MLKSLSVKNMTVFPQADLQFAASLNVIVGENGAGKTHLLKMAYSVIAACHEQNRRTSASVPTKTHLQITIADKLVNVFRPEALGRLARRKQGRERCDVKLAFQKKTLDVAFNFATNSKSEVNIERLPAAWGDREPVYLPTRELLSIFPNFASVYAGHYLELEETWYDTCLLLGRPLQRGPREQSIASLSTPLEEAMGGRIELDKKAGRFYLVNGSGRMEIPLVAEGVRKLGMLFRLISTGALMNKGYLFWDEPEANLNPRLIKQVAKSIVQLTEQGIQVFVATHSLFLLRELEIIISERTSNSRARFFGLQSSRDGIEVLQGDSVDAIGDIASLEEELQQSDRFLEIS